MYFIFPFIYDLIQFQKPIFQMEKEKEHAI